MAVVEQLDVAELEELFEVKKGKPRGRGGGDGREVEDNNKNRSVRGRSGSSNAAVILIDSKRSTNIGIQLHRLNLTPNRIRIALLRMDVLETLNFETISLLINCLPKDDELEIVRSYVNEQIVNTKGSGKLDVSSAVVARLGKVRLLFT